jgi:heptosyltransferase-2
MHAASVTGLPTIAIFGPTVLDFGFRPWNEKSAVVQLDLHCRPCAAHGGKKCPIGTHACMRDLSYRQVEKALFQLLAN